MPNRFERPPMPREPEEANLKFPEVYQSPEWKALPKIQRAQLLLVAEGVKPGTIIGGNFSSFHKLIEKMGLAARLNTEEAELDPVYEVASPEVLSQYHRDLVSLPEQAPDEEFDRLNGRFLGYPACCTEEYIDPVKNREEITERYGEKGQETVTNVHYEVRQLAEQGQPYPEELDFRPPTYTPCSATCPHALAVLSKWKQALEQADPEAAAALQRFHWQEEPYRSFHEEEVDKEDEAEIVEAKKRFLRKSAGLEE